ncbi:MULTISPECIES: hypothetical protein [unclassified Streptomyces]|uniref:hypothetical protein n=1 Tax=unclassified Streptomyces TaxID=2593676 RepID=UPI0013DC892C|nr:MULTISPECIES: hypothetical protein [unclassified Streptomyces]
MEAMDPDAIRTALPREPIAGSVAADRLAEALGTPNQAGERANVTAFEEWAEFEEHFGKRSCRARARQLRLPLRIDLPPRGCPVD